MNNLKIEIADYLNEYHGGRDTDLDANEAAEHIVTKLAEPHIREMIAEEIRDRNKAPDDLIADGQLDGYLHGIATAHQIAKGPQQ